MIYISTTLETQQTLDHQHQELNGENNGLHIVFLKNVMKCECLLLLKILLVQVVSLIVLFLNIITLCKFILRSPSKAPLGHWGFLHEDFIIFMGIFIFLNCYHFHHDCHYYHHIIIFISIILVIGTINFTIIINYHH